MYRESKAAYAHPQYGHASETPHSVLGASLIWLFGLALMTVLL